LNPYWRGGREPYYGPSWRPARRAAWKRDKESCRTCGRSSAELGERPTVHHVIAFKKFGRDRHEEANDLNNLVALCRPCHMKTEWKEHRRF
jgi:5-methylcytosine-specific restriction endonuclease McrA